MKKNPYLICYDIGSPERLRKIAKYLEKLGRRLQKSIFIAELSPHQIDATRKYLEKIADSSDNIIVIPLCRGCLDKITTLGDSIANYDII